MSRISLSSDGRRAVDKSGAVWDAQSCTVLRALSAGGQPGQSSAGFGNVKLTADGRLVMSSTLNQLGFWDVEGGSMLGHIDHPSIHVHDADVSADCQRAALLLLDGKQIAVVSLPSAETRPLEWKPGRLISIALSADGRRVVAGSDFRSGGQGWQHPADSPLVVWDLDTESPPRLLHGQGGGITRISLSADGRRAVTCGLDCAVIFWDLETGTVLRRLSGHKEWLWAVALSPDARFAISGGADRKLILWDLEAGELVTSLYLNGKIAALDWSANRIAVDSGVICFLEME